MALNYTAAACTPATFPNPVLFGAEILNVEANLVQNYTREVSDNLYYNNPSVSLKGVDFCNVTVTYTHPGQNDSITVETWLPQDTWNGRLQSVGGGGLIAGRFFLSYTAMAGAIGLGYASSSSDAGIGSSWPTEGGLVSEGNPNLYALQNFGSVALNDQAIIAKSIINDYYGQQPAYSYWSGCSQGGRQGLMLAQRYPDAYDGIAASAPAFPWGQMVGGSAWAQARMNMLNIYPFGCELDAIRQAAIDSCDAVDGVVDGLVSDPDACSFDPFALVGTVINCTTTGAELAITEGAATIANLTWTGPRDSNGGFLWYGPSPQARLTGVANPTSTSDLGYAMTTCTNGTCVGLPLSLGESWFEYFVEKDTSWNRTLITSVDEFTRLFHAGIQQYDSIIGTSDPDLTQFHKLGKKMIAYHGLADGIIPYQGSMKYYDSVAAITPDVEDYYRLFAVPGLGHCSSGSGGQPTATFQALVDWVEKGTVPETLPITFNDTAGVENNRILCPYPQKAQLKTGCANVTEAECFECV